MTNEETGYHTILRDGIFWTRVIGPANIRDAPQHLRNMILQQPVNQPIFEMIDLSSSKFKMPPLVDMKIAGTEAQSILKNTPGAYTAIYTNTKSFYGLMRLILSQMKTLNLNSELQIFNTKTDAMKYLLGKMKHWESNAK